MLHSPTGTREVHVVDNGSQDRGGVFDTTHTTLLLYYVPLQILPLPSRARIGGGVVLERGNTFRRCVFVKKGTIYLIFTQNTLLYWYLFTYFAVAYRSQKPDMGLVGGCWHFIESVYLRSFLTLGNLENFNLCQGWSNGRCLCGYVYRSPTGTVVSIGV